ncbi:MAG: hypothetical protein GX222_03875 [Ruminococcaceae bacterium]|nr:hypothetical protein [Oscillospiraceae bacterium]
MGKLLSDIFSMKFDVIYPISSSIVAVLLAGLFFSIRFFFYHRNKRRYEKRIRKQREAVVAENSTRDIKPSRTDKSDA